VYPFLLSSTHTPFARMVCFLILVTFIGSLLHQFIGLATSVPLISFTSEALTVLYTVVFSFNLLLPICQRTS
jgi:hypothetical protein